ncbi:hypothetical protein B0H14DRAFT_3439362 [Mycena olivaceomarginata]|nr:hypothetical protein B0H14DRAFT_3439362 [Mycena olivaceomarginata]
MQFSALRDVQIPEEVRTSRVQTTMETELWNQLEEDPHAAGFDLGIDNTTQQTQCQFFARGGQREAEDLIEDDNDDEFLAEIMQNAAINDPKEGDILDFDHQESAEPSVEWAPYPSRMLFLLDTLDNLPRLRISNSLMKVQKSLREKCEVPTTQYKTGKGNIFYMNDPRTIIAKIPEDGVIREIWHAQKWRRDMDLNNLSPMYDAKHLNAHFYVNEVARLDSGQLVILVRWLQCGQKICRGCFVWGVATVLDSETILINASELTANYQDLQDENCLPSWSEQTVKSGFPERMPNPKRVLAGGDPLYSSFI